MEKKYEEMAKVFKALSDPNRIFILEMLKSGEKCACKILEELHIGQSTLSHHMKILSDSGIIKCRRPSNTQSKELESPREDILADVEKMVNGVIILLMKMGAKN